jgi:hypothetical protein
MSAEALYVQLGHLIQTMPDLTAKGPFPVEALRWLGKAQALVVDAEGVPAEYEFNHWRNQLDNYSFRPASAERIASLIYRALATVELEVPASFVGTFIPAGNTFDAMAATTKIFTLARTELLIVDPYMDEKILIEFALLAPTGIRLKLLSDAAGYKETLITAAQKWAHQYGATRPLEIRLAPARTLHDRLVVVDQTLVWSVGQSFNALAVRAPTSFVKSDPETAALKVRAYGEDIWNKASLLTS